MAQILPAETKAFFFAHFSGSGPLSASQIFPATDSDLLEAALTVWSEVEA